MIFLRLIFGPFVLFCVPAFAVKHGSFGVGVGAYSSRTDKKVATGFTSSGANPVSATPLLLRYEYEITGNLYLAPQLMATLVPIKSWDESTSTSIYHLGLPLGGPLGGSSVEWDWLAGLGLEMYTIKGKGGTITLPNGSGTMDFAVAEGTKTSRLVTTQLGVSASTGSHRFGLDVILEELLSNEKRAYSTLLGYTYHFGGSY